MLHSTSPTPSSVQRSSGAVCESSSIFRQELCLQWAAGGVGSGFKGDERLGRRQGRQQLTEG